MCKFIFNVIDVWEQPDHLIIISDVADTTADFRHGDLLELRRPDGSCLQANGNSIIFDPPAERPLAVAIKGLSKADIPVGTQVWLVNPDRPPGKLLCKYERVSDRENT